MFTSICSWGSSIVNPLSHLDSAAHSSWLSLVRQPKAYGSVLFDAIVIGSAGAIGGFPAAVIAMISLVGTGIISSYGKRSAVRETTTEATKPAVASIAGPREGLPKVRWHTKDNSGFYSSNRVRISRLIHEKPQRREKSDGSWGYFFSGTLFAGKTIENEEVNLFYADAGGERYADPAKEPS